MNEVCGKKELSNTRCVNGHYVCNDCHTRGLGKRCPFSKDRD